MLNEFILYAAFGGALAFCISCAILKNKGLATAISILIGLALVLFVFPEPKAAKTLGDLANNISLIIQKAIYAAAWVAGSLATKFFCKMCH